VARTAADLAGSQSVDGSHLDEAARFRSPSSRPFGFEAAS
jgi:predicted ATPase with chaperone activity